MYRKSAQPPIPAPPTTSRRTGIGIRYGCHDPCFHEFAKLSIAALSFSGRRMANTPKLRKSAAISSAAGASLRLGTGPCIPQKFNTGHTTVEVGVLSEIAFHEKAGRSQGNSGFIASSLFFRRRSFCPPSSRCRHASIRTLEERIVSLGACWAFSIQPVLPSD